MATVHTFRHPVTDALKRRNDVRLKKVTRANRDRLPADLVALLAETA